MSTDEAATPDAAVAAPAAPAAGEEAKKEDGKGNNGARKRDETPIEELFDLSQPIPKVRRV